MPLFVLAKTRLIATGARAGSFGAAPDGSSHAAGPRGAVPFGLERHRQGEILSAVRGQGVASIDDVAAVVLETDATISVIPRATGGGDAPLAVLDGVVDGHGERVERTRV